MTKNHGLRIISLHDAIAECACGCWHYTGAGKFEAAHVEAEWDRHVAADRTPMRAMTHTPGPYRAEGGAVKAISHGIWFTVALVDKKRFTPEGRANNARLLAAAPELLEALKAIMARLEGEFDHPALMALGPLMTTTADIGTLAETAIAKAEGRTP